MSDLCVFSNHYFLIPLKEIRVCQGICLIISPTFIWLILLIWFILIWFILFNPISSLFSSSFFLLFPLSFLLQNTGHRHWELSRCPNLFKNKILNQNFLQLQGKGHMYFLQFSRKTCNEWHWRSISLLPINKCIM